MALAKIGAPVDEQSLSRAARHGLALARLQGFEPGQDFLQLMADRDSGRLDDADVKAWLDARHKRG